MSSDRSFRRFSAINSMPSSVIFEQPDSDNTVKFGNVCTETKGTKHCKKWEKTLKTFINRALSPTRYHYQSQV